MIHLYEAGAEDPGKSILTVSAGLLQVTLGQQT